MAVVATISGGEGNGGYDIDNGGGREVVTLVGCGVWGCRGNSDGSESGDLHVCVRLVIAVIGGIGYSGEGDIGDGSDNGEAMMVVPIVECYGCGVEITTMVIGKQQRRWW